MQEQRHGPAGEVRWSVRRAVVDSKRFSPAGLNEDRVWPVTDASDWPGVEPDETMNPDRLGGEVGDTMGTARVLTTPRTPTKAEREEHDGVSRALSPLVSILCHGKGDWRDAT